MIGAMAAGLLLVGLCFTAQAGPPVKGRARTITWMKVDAPPLFILSGPFRGLGYGEHILKILMREMDGYTHKQVVASVGRHIYNLRAGQQVCSVGLYRTPEREQIAWFSEPAFFTLPSVLVVRKETKEEVGGNRPLSLERLLDRPDIRIGIARDRSYGQPVDEILARHRGEKKLVVFSRQRLFADLFKMVLDRRVDGVLGMPAEVMYHAERSGVGDWISTLEIAENRENMESWFGYVACSRTDWGRAVVNRINQVLRRERGTADYRRGYERWLDPAMVETYRILYERDFLGRQGDQDAEQQR